VPIVTVIGYVPTGEVVVAVVLRLGAPVVPLAWVSPFTNPVMVQVNGGFAERRVLVSK
jgi:hypothetical protein